MLDHVVLSVSDYEKAKAFYLKALAPIGYELVMGLVSMRHWSLEERKKQSQLIQQWKPWKQSTGAKSSMGKKISKMNAYKHGGRRADIRDAAKFIAECKRSLKNIKTYLIP